MGWKEPLQVIGSSDLPMLQREELTFDQFVKIMKDITTLLELSMWYARQQGEEEEARRARDEMWGEVLSTRGFDTYAERFSALSTGGR